MLGLYSRHLKSAETTSFQKGVILVATIVDCLPIALTIIASLQIFGKVSSAPTISALSGGGTLSLVVLCNDLSLFCIKNPPIPDSHPKKEQEALPTYTERSPSTLPVYEVQVLAQTLPLRHTSNKITELPLGRNFRLFILNKYTETQIELKMETIQSEGVDDYALIIDQNNQPYFFDKEKQYSLGYWAGSYVIIDRNPARTPIYTEYLVFKADENNILIAYELDQNAHLDGRVQSKGIEIAINDLISQNEARVSQYRDQLRANSEPLVVAYDCTKTTNVQLNLIFSGNYHEEVLLACKNNSPLLVDEDTYFGYTMGGSAMFYSIKNRRITSLDFKPGLIIADGKLIVLNLEGQSILPSKKGFFFEAQKLKYHIAHSYLLTDRQNVTASLTYTEDLATQESPVFPVANVPSDKKNFQVMKNSSIGICANGFSSYQLTPCLDQANNYVTLSSKATSVSQEPYSTDLRKTLFAFYNSPNIKGFLTQSGKFVPINFVPRFQIVFNNTYQFHQLQIVDPDNQVIALNDANELTVIGKIPDSGPSALFAIPVAFDEATQTAFFLNIKTYACSPYKRLSHNRRQLTSPCVDLYGTMLGIDDIGRIGFIKHAEQGNSTLFIPLPIDSIICVLKSEHGFAVYNATGQRIGVDKNNQIIHIKYGTLTNDYAYNTLTDQLTDYRGKAVDYCIPQTQINYQTYQLEQPKNSLLQRQ